jgi:magnesium transporter
VYLLNISRGDPDGHKMINGAAHDGIPTDIISSIQTRRSMQARRSIDPNRHSMGSNGYGRTGDREGLIHAYDEEENIGFGLTDLAEDSDEDAPLKSVNGKANGNENVNGNGNGNENKRSFSEPIERPKKSSPR